MTTPRVKVAFVVLGLSRADPRAGLRDAEVACRRFSPATCANRGCTGWGVCRLRPSRRVLGIICPMRSSFRCAMDSARTISAPPCAGTTSSASTAWERTGTCAKIRPRQASLTGFALMDRVPACARQPAAARRPRNVLFAPTWNHESIAAVVVRPAARGAGHVAPRAYDSHRRIRIRAMSAGKCSRRGRRLRGASLAWNWWRTSMRTSIVCCRTLVLIRTARRLPFSRSTVRSCW